MVKDIKGELVDNMSTPDESTI